MTKAELKQEEALNRLYRAVWNEEHHATDTEKSEANKVSFLYSCGRLSILEACYRLTLIYNHHSDDIYERESLEAANLLK